MGILQKLIGRRPDLPEAALTAIDRAERAMAPLERAALVEVLRTPSSVTINVFVIAVGGGAHIGDTTCNGRH